MTTLEKLIQHLWEDFLEMNPTARAVNAALASQGEPVLADHFALRTVDDPRVRLDTLMAPFVEAGYRQKGQYTFSEKKIRAKHYEHRDSGFPKVFASELKLRGFSDGCQRLMKMLIDQVPEDLVQRWDFPVSGRLWTISHAVYEQLRGESQYAAWFAAFGFRATHFAVNVNAFQRLTSLEALNAFLEAGGFELDRNGGVIKGSQNESLEQSSLKAQETPVKFSEGTYSIPATYYEFAKRYPMPDGTLFQGFLSASADKFFESTNKG